MSKKYDSVAWKFPLKDIFKLAKDKFQDVKSAYNATDREQKLKRANELWFIGKQKAKFLKKIHK